MHVFFHSFNKNVLRVNPPPGAAPCWVPVSRQPLLSHRLEEGGGCGLAPGTWEWQQEGSLGRWHRLIRLSQGLWLTWGGSTISAPGGGAGCQESGWSRAGPGQNRCPCRPAEAPVTRGQRSQRIGAWSRPPLSALWAVPSAALEAPGRWTDSCGREDRGKVAPEPGSAPQGLPAPPSAPGRRAGSERTGRGPGSFLPRAEGPAGDKGSGHTGPWPPPAALP